MTGGYLMDDPREAGRLRAKVDADAWAARTLAPLIAPGAKVLELGCGPGHLTSAVARLACRPDVSGADLSKSRIAEARATLPEGDFRVADAHALPYESGHFDVVYSRFLFQYLRDKPLATREAVRVLRPGGRLLLQDLDGQLVWHHPVDNDLHRDMTRVLHAMEATGFDPCVGRKLYRLAYRAGLTDLAVDVTPYHLYAGRIGPEDERLWELKLDIAMPVVAKALGGEAAARSLKARFMHYLRREDTFTYSVVMTVVGRKP